MKFLFKNYYITKQPQKLPWSSTPLNFEGASDNDMKLLSYSILMRTFQNLPNKLDSIHGSEKVVSPRILADSFVCK